jgi:cytochrome c-type biogenesis protein CcmH/NrfG
MEFQMSGIYLEKYGYAMYHAAMEVSNAINPTIADLKFNYYVLQQLIWVVVILLLGSLLFVGPWVWPTDESATKEWLQEISEERGPTYDKFFSSDSSTTKEESTARGARLAELRKTLQKEVAPDEYAEPRFPLWAVGVGAGTLALAQLSLFLFGSYSGLGSSL